MADNKPHQAACPLGEETILASIKAGYVNLTLGLIALYENGFVPGEIFSRKQLVDCDLGVDLAKTIMNQCEGREFDKRKTTKKRILKRTTKALTDAENMELGEIVKQLSAPNWFRDSINGINSKILYLINNEPGSKLNRVKPPKSSSVKALFSKVQYANQSQPLDLSPFKAKHGRGRPSRLFIIPTPDEYAELFNIKRSNNRQFHNKISGHKTSRSFCNAVFGEWMEKNQKGEKNIHPMSELCDVLGDSEKTVRNRNSLLGIKVKHNFFSYSVTHQAVKALLLRCRGGCWFELVLPGSGLPGNVAFGAGGRVAPRYRVNKAGLTMARKKWKDAGAPGDFEKHLKICGIEANSYILPEKLSAS